MTKTLSLGLVVFDWAGTVVDFGCCGPANAFVEAFQSFGVDATLEEARRPMGLAKKEHIRVMLREPALAARWLRVTGSPPSESDVDALYQVVTPKQIDAAGRLGKPLAGVHECVEWIRQRGGKIAGTTGYFREAAEAARETAHSHGYSPDVNVCADDVVAGRPAPWMLFRAMEATGIYPASRVVKIGDTAADIGEGLNAGAFTIGVIDSSNGMGVNEHAFADLSDSDRENRRRMVAAQFADAGAHSTINHLDELRSVLENDYPRWLEQVQK